MAGPHLLRPAPPLVPSGGSDQVQAAPETEVACIGCGCHRLLLRLKVLRVRAERRKLRLMRVRGPMRAVPEAGSCAGCEWPVVCRLDELKVSVQALRHPALTQEDQEDSQVRCRAAVVRVRSSAAYRLAGLAKVAAETERARLAPLAARRPAGQAGSRARPYHCSSARHCTHYSTARSGAPAVRPSARLSRASVAGGTAVHPVSRMYPCPCRPCTRRMGTSEP